ncbi:MAG: hypothetical protein ACYC3I_06105 [Gemmataceae bacterium]
MAQTASSPDQKDNRQKSSQLTPPDEQFWQRYSPHAEFPLSSVGSFVLHLLLFGILGLMAWLGAMLFNNGSRSLPVEAVRLDLGGGGGNPHGQGDGPNNGEPVEAGPQTNENPVENQNQPDDTPAPRIKVDPSAKVKQNFDAEHPRFLELPNTEQSRAFERLGDKAKRIRVPDRSNSSGYGQGGKGSGGGSGDGKGTGVGNGQGEGRGTLTQREKRMLRWSMLFNTDSGQDYVAQLNGLGAILAIPVREDGNVEYKVVKNLAARPAKLEDEDISQIQRIYWIDDKPRSVGDVLSTLGILLPRLPSHFYAFMPEELEKKLYDLEKAYLKKHYRGKTEENILETKFRINRSRGKFEPEVIGLKFK